MSWNKYVLDSSALLAVAYEEPGADFVRSIVPQSVLSVVNLAESVGVLVADNVPADEATERVQATTSGIIDFSVDIALLSARIVSDTKAYGLSLADRACVATAMHLQLEAITADKIWGKLKLPVKIRVIR